MTGGVLGKRERRGPTHTLLMLRRPPAPKNIALNRQGRRGFTGPVWTSWCQNLFVYPTILSVTQISRPQLCR